MCVYGGWWRLRVGSNNGGDEVVGALHLWRIEKSNWLHQIYFIDTHHSPSTIITGQHQDY